MNEFADSAKSAGAGMKVFGIIAMIFGVFSILAPGVVGLSVVLVIGILVLLAGLARMIWAFQAGSLGRGIFKFAVGGLTVLCGAALLSNPLIGSGVLSILLALYFLIDGVAETVIAFRLRPTSGWGVLFFAGLLSIVLGIIMWRQFPISGAWAIGILLGLKLILIGTIMLTVGSTLRTAANE